MDKLGNCITQLPNVPLRLPSPNWCMRMSCCLIRLLRHLPGSLYFEVLKHTYTCLLNLCFQLDIFQFRNSFWFLTAGSPHRETNNNNMRISGTGDGVGGLWGESDQPCWCA